MISIYDTALHAKVKLESLELGKIRMYVCGPTVYNYIHIGNARTFISFDVIRRYLEWRGFEVVYVSGSRVCRVGVGEQFPDVAATDGAKQSIGNGMRKHVSIGMAQKTQRVRDLNPAKNKLATFYQGMNIHALPHTQSHGIKRLGSDRLGCDRGFAGHYLHSFWYKWMTAASRRS